MDDPVLFIKQLQKQFKLKGSAPTQHHLGCDLVCDKDKTLCMDPSGYISRMEESCVSHFDIKPEKDIGPVHSPLVLKYTQQQNSRDRNRPNCVIGVKKPKKDTKTQLELSVYWKTKILN